MKSSSYLSKTAKVAPSPRFGISGIVAPAGRAYRSYLRPAGDAAADAREAAVRAEIEAKLGAINDAADTSTAMDPAQQTARIQAGLTTAQNLLSTLATAFTTAYSAGQVTYRQQLLNDTQVALARLGSSAQALQLSDPAAASSALSTIAALQARLTTLGPTPAPAAMSTGTKIALGVGAVALVGGLAYILATPRRNPVVGHGRSRHYVKPRRNTWGY